MSAVIFEEYQQAKSGVIKLYLIADVLNGNTEFLGRGS